MLRHLLSRLIRNSTVVNLTAPWTTIVLSSLFLSSIVDGQESVHWESQKVSPHFWGEGGNVADLDGDGFNDLIAGPNIYWGPEFKVAKGLVEASPVSIIGYSKFFFGFDWDIDRDGDLDVLIIGFPGEAAHWFQNPGGAKGRTEVWKQHVVLDNVDNESPMFLDITGDGKPEIVCCNGGSFGYAEIPSDPSQKWTFHPVSENANHQRFTHGIGAGDVNDDGRIDVMCKDGWWEQPTAISDKPWTFHPVPFSGPGGAQMYAVDLDGDSKTEVVTSLAAHGYGLVVYKKKSSDQGEFQWEKIDLMTEKVETSPTGLAISQLHAIDIADMDRDGKPDIVAGKRFWAHNGSDRGENEPPLLVWFKPIVGTGGLRFIPNIIDADSGVGTQIVAKDINKDGYMDVLSVSKRGIHVLTQKKGIESESKPVSVAKSVVAISDGLGGYRPARGKDDAMNMDFETGDLRDWKTTGAAFFNQPIRGDEVNARRNDMKSGHQGEFWIGSFEITGDVAFGTLTSAPFQLTKPWVSFLQAGGSTNETRVEIVDAKSDKVLAQSVGSNSETLKRVVMNLEKYVGSEIMVRVVDSSKDGWGHINFDDFRLHDSEPQIPAAQRLLTLDKIQHQSLPPDQVASAMTLHDGFSLEVIASEPAVRQPIAMTIDHRGRLWVAESYQYPIRAKGDEGTDRVLIFEDTDGNGSLDKSTLFADKLNLVSGIEVGLGGLWVGAAPYLLFIPDKNGDDVPDGPAIKKLEGWGYQDTHETLNSFIWGPDGWLYGCHGVFTHSDVRVVKKTEQETAAGKSTKINAGIWRYHPQSESFEVFAHGTSNPWGVDFNEYGDAFLTACVIPHLYHIIPQARYQRQAGQHFNPYTYADIQTIARHRHWLGDNPHAGNNRSDSAGGGHAHSGAMFYLGGSWPEQYHNQLFMNNIHGARLNQDKIVAQGSGYYGDRAPDFLLANDASSQILYFRSGPDGQVIAIDWYDAQQCHLTDPSKHDQSNGRIYRIAYNNAKPVQVDLSKLSDLQLVKEQRNKNDWYARTARRLLMERTVAKEKLSNEAISELNSQIVDKEVRTRLHGLWTMAACQLLTDAVLQKMLGDSDAHVRGWAVRLITQAKTASKSHSTELISSSRLIELAKADPSPIVRLELASACQLLPVESARNILRELVTHAEDAGDHNLPLMYWYAVSRLAEANPKSAIALLDLCQIDLVSEFLGRQLTQQWVAGDGSKGAAEFIALLKQNLAQKDLKKSQKVLDAVLVSLESKRTIEAPAGWGEIAANLLAHSDASVRLKGAQLASKLNDAGALKLLKEMASNTNSAAEQRLSALSILKQVKAEGVSEIAFSMLSSPELRTAACSAIADSLDVESAHRLLDIALQWKETGERRSAWFSMLRRANTAEVLLKALESKKLAPSELTADMVQQIQRLNSDELMSLVGQVWGNVRSLDQDKQKAVAKIRSLVEQSSESDINKGKAVFTKVCGQCHVLFGEGGKIGPELTGSNRRDLNYLLENIMDPSAVMAKEYQPIVIQTVDDQVVTGLVRESNDNAIRLQTATEEVVIYTADIATKKQSASSMMPADLLTPLSEEDIRNLFSYLRK